MFKTEKEFLESYNINEYERPSVTTDVVVLTTDNEYNSLKILLIKRKGYPFQGSWALPGGFVSIDEDIEVGARRELIEETNVECDYIEQLYTFGKPNRDPRTRVISVSYLALIKAESLIDVKAGDDASDANWFNVKIVNPELDTFVLENTQTNEILTMDNLAFDHKDIIQLALNRLKNKVEYTDVAFSLVPDVFTLYQIQKVYELLLQRSVHKSNFRREIIKKLDRQEGTMVKQSAGRPAEGYSLHKGQKNNKY